MTQPPITSTERESLNRANCACCLISATNCPACPWKMYKALRTLAEQETPRNLSAIRSQFQELARNTQQNLSIA